MLVAKFFLVETETQNNADKSSQTVSLSHAKCPDVEAAPTFRYIAALNVLGAIPGVISSPVTLFRYRFPSNVGSGDCLPDCLLPISFSGIG